MKNTYISHKVHMACKIVTISYKHRSNYVLMAYQRLHNLQTIIHVKAHASKNQKM
jgi:hypothetical protein